MERLSLPSSGTMFYALVLIALSVLILRCTRRETATDTLEYWLEKHFPGRFDIVDTQTEDPIRNLSFKVKRSVVADKSDPLVQIRLRWDKRAPGEGLSVETVDSLLAQARQQMSDTRHFFETLKTAGMSRTSAGILSGHATVLVFDDPTPENRKLCLSRVGDALAQWPAAGRYGLEIIFMEPDKYTTEFGDIVPLTHWVRADSWQRRNTILSILLPEGYAFDPKQLGSTWQFNLDSDMLARWSEESRPLAEQWAKTHLKKPVTFLPFAQYEALKDEPGALLQYAFTYDAVAGEEPNIDGYVGGEYRLDHPGFEKPGVFKP